MYVHIVYDNIKLFIGTFRNISLTKTCTSPCDGTRNLQHSDKNLCRTPLSSISAHILKMKRGRYVGISAHRLKMKRGRYVGISAHRLNIKRGRYVAIPRQEWYCTRCNNNTDDGEKYFLLSCYYAIDERDTLFELINKSCKNFNNFDSDNKLSSSQ